MRCRVQMGWVGQLVKVQCAMKPRNVPARASRSRPSSQPRNSEALPLSTSVPPQLTRSGACVLLARNSFLGLPSRAVTFSSPGFDLNNATLSCLRVTGTFECLQPGWAMAYVQLDSRYTWPPSDAACAQQCLDYGAICEGYRLETWGTCLLLASPFMRTTNSQNRWGNTNWLGDTQRVCLRTRSTRQLIGDAAAAPPAPPSPPPPFWLVGNVTRNTTGNGTANGTALPPPPFWIDVDVNSTFAGRREGCQTDLAGRAPAFRTFPATCCCECSPVCALQSISA